MIGAVPLATTIDARGSAEPLVDLIRAVRRAGAGTAVASLVAERSARIEIPRWTAKAGHRLVEVESLDDCDRFVVLKGG